MWAYVRPLVGVVASGMGKNVIRWSERRRLADRLLAEYEGKSIPCYFRDHHPDGMQHVGLMRWARVHRVPNEDRTGIHPWVTFPSVPPLRPGLEITPLDRSGPLVAENLILACRACIRRRSKPTYGPPALPAAPSED